MRLGAAVANAAWLLAGVPESRRFARALSEPDETQARWLRARLAADGRTAYGMAYDFGGVRDAAEFARRVPLATYEDLAPWIARVRRGERDVLCADLVSHLVPTSGSTGARKLIPFTRSLGRAFDAAVGAWVHDLARQRPDILGGPAYWSISPLAAADADADHDADDDAAGTTPVGFGDDAEYLGGARASLVRRLLAVPSSVRLAAEERSFWRLTLLALLRCRDLRLVSVWHPSFLTLLVAAAPPAWAELLDAVAHGTNPWLDAIPAIHRGAWRARADSTRARELREIGPLEWRRWWPRLAVASCWGHQAAEGGWRRLASDLPGVLVQRKGLLATEGVVTIPWGGEFPLAVTSHYFEFLDELGGVRRAGQLQRGGRYEVVLTNDAGLWRYRLGDVVECTGHVRATPSLRFLGRAGSTSDLRGEKLAEAFVADALRGLWDDGTAPGVATLVARECADEAGYELVLSADGLTQPAELLGRRLEAALGRNPHYALARRLGQLAPLRVRVVSGEAAAAALRGESRARGTRLGDVKPRALVPLGAGTTGLDA